MYFCGSLIYHIRDKDIGKQNNIHLLLFGYRGNNYGKKNQKKNYVSSTKTYLC